MRKTKIVGTIGPVSQEKTVLLELVKAGLNVARFNFSHDSYEAHFRRFNLVKEINQELKTYVGTMLDTKGPEIRTHLFKNGIVTILEGSKVVITMNELLGDENIFSVTYSGLFDDVAVGKHILVDDGYLELVVVDKDFAKKEIITIAKNTHTIKDRRGINVPGVVLNMPFISDKDLSDILVACEKQFDYIALSFVRRATDIYKIKELLNNNNGSNIEIIAKIENQEAIDNLEEIIEASDGIMVARGDLGVEVLPEELPHLQKLMTRLALKHGKYVIVATQMLESMQTNPRPTRAEVSDVANSIYDGADATMLSGESAAGKYPRESVLIMSKISERTEYDVHNEEIMYEVYKNTYANPTDTVSLSAVISAHKGLTKAIVAYGKDVANCLSKYRSNVPVFAVVDTLCEATSLAIKYGIFPVLSVSELNQELKKMKLIKGELIVHVKENELKVEKY